MCVFACVFMCVFVCVCLCVGGYSLETPVATTQPGLPLSHTQAHTSRYITPSKDQTCSVGSSEFWKRRCNAVHRARSMASPSSSSPPARSKTRKKEKERKGKKKAASRINKSHCSQKHIITHHHLYKIVCLAPPPTARTCAHALSHIHAQKHTHTHPRHPTPPLPHTHTHKD